MSRITENKIILVTRKTRLEDLIVRYNTVAQAKFYIEHLGADFTDYVMENETYQKSVREVRAALEMLGRVQVVDRDFLPNFIFGGKDLVVVLGQDGLVANTLKYLESQLLIGVNPDPGRWDGVLLPFRAEDVKLAVQDAFAMKRPIKEITMAKALLNDNQVMYAVNDLFIGHKTHISARYQVELGGQTEQHSSSGILVSTGFGSTGWMKSVLSGAVSIVNSMSENKIKIKENKIDWGAKQLYFSVLEPFPSKTSQVGIVFGKVTAKEPLKVLSQMPENGVIFSDGIENDFLQFNSGVQATIMVAEKRGHLVV